MLNRIKQRKRNIKTIWKMRMKCCCYKKRLRISSPPTAPCHGKNVNANVGDFSLRSDV